MPIYYTGSKQQEDLIDADIQRVISDVNFIKRVR